jgi:hypothetical protein
MTKTKYERKKTRRKSGNVATHTNECRVCVYIKSVKSSVITSNESYGAYKSRNTNGNISMKWMMRNV